MLDFIIIIFLQGFSCALTIRQHHQNIIYIILVIHLLFILYCITCLLPVCPMSQELVN